MRVINYYIGVIFTHTQGEGKGKQEEEDAGGAAGGSGGDVEVKGRYIVSLHVAKICNCIIYTDQMTEIGDD